MKNVVNVIIMINLFLFKWLKIQQINHKLYKHADALKIEITTYHINFSFLCTFCTQHITTQHMHNITLQNT